MAFSPSLDILPIPNGYFWNFAGCAVTLTGDGNSVVEDFSSRYSGLVNFYDVDARAACAEAKFIDGPALVLADDIRPANFCHWLIDAMPRLAAFDARSRRSEWFVVVPPLTAAYQYQALEMCGISRDRVVEVADHAMVRARLLVVTNDIRNMPHPAFKAAPWAMSFLQSTLGLRSSVARRHGNGDMPRKIFVSRGDAPGRRIVNEDALTAMLAGKGYRSVSMAGLSLAEQVAYFVDATHVVGMHGAGLSHVAFTTQAASVVEIFSPTYGTPAFYVLAAGAGAEYATYVENNVVASSRTQLDNVVVDVARFAESCGRYL